VHVAWACAGGFACLIVGFNVVVYVYRARVLRRLAPGDTGDGLGPLDAAWAFAKECAACAAVVFLIPVGWALPRCRTGGGNRGPIILVHGRSPARGSLWLLRRRLLRDGWSRICCLASTGICGDLEPAAARLRHVVEDMARTTPQRPLILVGYGFGGLVLRYYARRYPTPGVRRIVTLGTPHAGTELAALLPGLGSKLGPHASWLTRLTAADRVPLQFDVIAIHSTFDALVQPPVCAEYPGAFNVRVTDVGHYTLLFSHKIYALLAENLAAPLR
jgi:pimeloyl-ACP methyl ester carboxylesterase